MPNLTKSQRHNKHLEATMAFYRKTTKECPKCLKLNYYEMTNCHNCNATISDVNTLQGKQLASSINKFIQSAKK